MVIETYRKFKLLGDRVEDVLYTETRVYEDLRPSKLEDFTIIQLWQTSTRTHEIVKYDASHGPCHVHKFYEGQADFLDFGKSQKIVKDIRADQQALVNKLKGTPASAGKVRGTVCYLKSAKENNKIKKGQILVVSNTTPDFMPALKKAAAIVTNEGGLTCHAAIVSRELKIPSIVGTKIATQVFKDGDLVEVDANLGIIKKI